MKFKRFALLLCALALLGAACGGDSDGSDAATDSPEDTAPAQQSGECSLDEPLKIVGLAETTGEGAQAVPYYANGWELGVEAVNEAGGICGQEVDFERLPISPTDNAAAKNSLLEAVDKGADVIMGMPNSATVVALAADVAQNQTPMIWFSSPPNAYRGVEGSVGSEWGFLIRPRTIGVSLQQVDYMVNTLGKKKIGLLCINQTFGQQGCDATVPAIEEAGGEVVAKETHEVTDTNLTSKVIAMKNAGAEAVIGYTFPNTAVVFFNQMSDNGVDIPIITGAVTGLAIATGNVKPEAIPNLYGFDDCAPAVEERAADFAAAYAAKFDGAKPSYSAAQAYDSLFIIKEAVEKAGSNDKAAIRDALDETDYDGACTHYKADEEGGLGQSAVLESFSADGTPKVEKTVDLSKK